MDVKTLLSNTDKELARQALLARQAGKGITKEELKANAKKAIQAIEARAWLLGTGYTAPHFPLFTQKLEGLESGLYLFAGESNAGKSACMMNIFWDLILHKENKLYGIYFSLDDAKTEIYPRVIAMQQCIPIGCVKKPQPYQDKAKESPEAYGHHIDWLAKREIGFEDLFEQTEYVSIFDTSHEDEGCSTEEAMYHSIKKIQQAVKKADPDANIIVAIDAIDDIRLKTDSTDRAEVIARTVKHWSVELDIPVFASKHLKKLNANRRPTLDDLRDSNTLVYEASAVFLIANDVSKNKQQAKVFYYGDDEEIKQPIIEFDWAKNKKSSFKGMTFCHFVPDFSKLSECTIEQGKHYESSMYSL